MGAAIDKAMKLFANFSRHLADRLQATSSDESGARLRVHSGRSCLAQGLLGRCWCCRLGLGTGACTPKM
jgi:hypothetical protein